MNKSLAQEFVNPPSVYRGKPFWAWNGKLEHQELRRQIRIMKRMGLGGFFMHARVGLDTPYLAKEWFENVSACIDEAGKNNMEAWLYDEDRWPSGSAGGIVTKDKRYRMRKLMVKAYTSPKGFSWSADVVGAFCVSQSGTMVSNIRRLAKNEKPKSLEIGQSILAFIRIINEETDWHNGQTYLDTMNPAAVKAFIKVTHDAYLKRYGSLFGKIIPGIFTDEPNHGSLYPGWDWKQNQDVYLPWTDNLPVVFRKRYGYDILDHLPELAFDIEGRPASQARYHYHDCTTFLFVDSFSRQIGEWCEKNNILFTGHVLEEDSPESQTEHVGSAMRFYEYMQAPGMDLLTEHWRVYDTAKQVSSMARQFGWKWRLTETYGCTGWDFPFAGHKALSDWQTALGINLRCQHLSWYTMLGEAKRDYPAGIFYQSPWWELYPKVEDYFGRIHAVMTRGEEVRDLLVIHPIESTWLHCKTSWKKDEAVKTLNKKLIDLRDSLLCEHIDFDYGEEEVISRHGKVVKGKNGPEVTIKKGRYTAILVPKLDTIRSTTLALLRKFKEMGGLVVFAGEPPKLVDAVLSDEARLFAVECVSAPENGPALASAVASTRRVSITDISGKEVAPALYLLREDKESYYLFICNTSMSQEQMKEPQREQPMVRDRKESFPQVIISGFADCEGRPLELDPETGEIYSAHAVQEKSGWKITSSLPTLGSRLFIIPKLTDKGDYKVRQQLVNVRTEPLAQETWPVRLSECNNLVLDRASYKIGKNASEGPEEILRIDKYVRDALKIKHRGGAMVQPWARIKPKTPHSIPVELTYQFNAEALPSGDLFLAIEEVDKFTLQINGKSVNTDVENGWWVDLSLRKIPIDPNLIRLGKNLITLNIDYQETFSGFEIIYLLGNFGTKVDENDVSITAPVNMLKTGDWALQGLSFYSGSVSYCASVSGRPGNNERMFVCVPEYRGTAIRIIINNTSAGIIAWEPNEVDITDFLIDGVNEVLIEVVGHRRNSHGPHHYSNKWPVWTGPDQFQSNGDEWFDGYNLVPCGLMAEPVLSIRRIEG